MMNGFEPRLKIHDNKEVNQNDGEYEPVSNPKKDDFIV